MVVHARRDAVDGVDVDDGDDDGLSGLFWMSTKSGGVTFHSSHSSWSGLRPKHTFSIVICINNVL